MAMLADPAPHQAAIIIFGAAVRPNGEPSPALRGRVAAALALGARLPAPLYVPTGGKGRFGDSEAQVMWRLLRRAGVQKSEIALEETAVNTLSSVRATAGLLRRRGHAGVVYAATSAYHLPRCLLLLRLAGVPALACPPPPGLAASKLVLRWYWRLREIPAILVDGSLMVALRAIRRH